MDICHLKKVELEPKFQILESLYKFRIRESDQPKTVLELDNLEIHQKKAKHDYQRLKTMVKTFLEQNLRSRNLKPEMRGLSQEPWLRGQDSRKKTACTKNSWRLLGNGQPTGSVRKETIAVSGTIGISVLNSTPLPASFS